jgi:hypothetical protein
MRVDDEGYFYFCGAAPTDKTRLGLSAAAADPPAVEMFEGPRRAAISGP